MSITQIDTTHRTIGKISFRTKRYKSLNSAVVISVVKLLFELVDFGVQSPSFFSLHHSHVPLLFFPFLFKTAFHVTAKTMRLRMRKASQQPNPSLASRPSRTKRRHSEVEEDTPTSGGRGLFSTIKKFIRGNAVKVKT